MEPFQTHGLKKSLLTKSYILLYFRIIVTGKTISLKEHFLLFRLYTVSYTEKVFMMLKHVNAEHVSETSKTFQLYCEIEMYILFEY